MSELAYKRTNVYEIADEKLMKEIFDYAETMGESIQRFADVLEKELFVV